MAEIFGDYAEWINGIRCLEVFVNCDFKDASRYLSLVVDYVKENRREIGSIQIHFNKDRSNVERYIIEYVENLNNNWSLDKLNLTPDNFTEETDPDYGLDWLVFESKDQTITIKGYHYNPSGYRIEILVLGDSVIITSDITEEGTIREDNPEATPWMNLWWNLYNSSIYYK